MDLRCFVKMLPGPGGVPPGGTGYLISRDRVLTAAHVVGDAVAVSIQYDKVDGSGVVTLDAEVRWRGDESCDVALLVLSKGPVGFDVPLPKLAEAPIDTTTPWESRGWALAAPPAELVQDSMVDLSGDASPFLPSQKRSQLTVGPRPQRIDLWRGISGAPVFERGGSRRLLGVVAAAPENFENVLHASPLAAALHQEDFLAALGSEIARERRNRLIADVKTLLAGAPMAANAIADGSATWRSRYGKGDVAALTDELLDATDVSEALLALNRAHQSLWPGAGERRAAAKVVERVVAHIAPLLVQRGLLHALPNESGGVLLRLPVTTTTVAELAVAGFDGRPSLWAPAKEDYPDGAGRLPRPSEMGFDASGRDTLRAYGEHFEKSLLTRSDREALERRRRRSPSGETEALDQVFRLVDEELSFQAEHGDHPLRRYLLYDETFAADQAPFLRELRARLRSIHLVETTGDDLVGERRIGRPLRDILARGGATSDE